MPATMMRFMSEPDMDFDVYAQTMPSTDTVYMVAAVAVGTMFINYWVEALCRTISPIYTSSIWTAPCTFTQEPLTLDRIQNILRLGCITNPFRASSIPGSSWNNRGYLERLPMRQGSRPRVGGVFQHKQITQVPSEETDLFARLRCTIMDICDRYPQRTYLGRSTFESGTASLFARYRTFEKTKYHSEILHAHPADASLHVSLHPADIKVVIENGWGEQHPLAADHSAGSICRKWIAPVSSDTIMVYAPRNDEELEISRMVMEAAVWWAGVGIDAEDKIDDSD